MSRSKQKQRQRKKEQATMSATTIPPAATTAAPPAAPPFTGLPPEFQTMLSQLLPDIQSIPEIRRQLQSMQTPPSRAEQMLQQLAAHHRREQARVTAAYNDLSRLSVLEQVAPRISEAQDILGTFLTEQALKVATAPAEHDIGDAMQAFTILGLAKNKTDEARATLARLESGMGMLGDYRRTRSPDGKEGIMVSLLIGGVPAAIAGLAGAPTMVAIGIGVVALIAVGAAYWIYTQLTTPAIPSGLNMAGIGL